MLSAEVFDSLDSLISRLNEISRLNTTCWDVSMWDVSAITDMSFLFMNYSGPALIGLSDWNVSQVESMQGMFSGAKGMIHDLSKWEVFNVTSMDYMFQGSTSLALEIGAWDVSNVQSMNYMFSSCIDIDVDISKWRTPRLKSMHAMFRECDVLGVGGVSGWDVSAVTDMSDTFNKAKNCGLLEQWDVSAVKDMSGMFEGSSNTGCGDIGRWKVSSVWNMRNMFKKCSMGKNGFDDISDWDVSAVSDFSSMFRDYHAPLKSINRWDLSGAYSTDMGHIEAGSKEAVSEIERLFKDMELTCEIPLNSYTVPLDSHKRRRLA